MNILKICIVFLFCFVQFNLVAAEIINPDFVNDISGWTVGNDEGNRQFTTAWNPSWGYNNGPSMFIRSRYDTNLASTGTAWGYQDIDVTGCGSITFWAEGGVDTSEDEGGYARVSIGGNSVNINCSPTTEYELQITGSGIQELRVETYGWQNQGLYYSNSYIYADHFQLNELPAISGYVKRSDSSPIYGATILLNNSGGSTTTDESGYYSLTGISAGSYIVTVSKGGYYSDETVKSITGLTTHNVTLEYSPPYLTSLSILDSGDNSLLLGWKESLGADGVYVYVDSQTNLVATVETPYTNIKMYDLTNLEPGTSYNVWCKPYKDTMQGPMYYVGGTTLGGGGGGGGGGAVEVLPPLEDFEPETPEYPEAYDITNITSSDFITLAATNPEVIYKALSNITIKSPLPDKPGDNLLYFYLLIISVCSALFSSKKEGWEVVTIISFVVVVISLIKLGWI